MARRLHLIAPNPAPNPAPPGCRPHPHLARWLLGTLALLTLGLLVLGAAALAGSGSIGTANDQRAGGPSLRVGSLRLTRCARAPLTYCGALSVPLDYTRAADSPRLRIAFRWLPATSGTARGTVLAVEGGPGYSSIGSRSWYRSMLGPLSRSRDLLLVDLRGSGESDAIDCRGLERYTDYQHEYGTAFDRLVAACGTQLNHTWRYRDGGFVHGSEMFNTVYSARDVAALLRALDPGRVDLYGDSYGSWFAQVFALRYPSDLRSLTLDSTYQLLGIDPWYASSADSARAAFDTSCAQWPACARAQGTRSWALISALARSLRARPLHGATTTETGAGGTVTVNVETLVNLVNNAGFDPLIYRDLDGAASAYLRHGFAAPLLRLAALSIGFDDVNDTLPYFSDGLYFAVSCTDYTQLFDRTATRAVRSREYARALTAQSASTFAPFTVREWTQMSQYNEAYSACLAWPRADRLQPVAIGHPNLVAHRLRVLVLSGSLDTLTPRADGATIVARALGGAARLVTVANLTHVVLADDDAGCPTSLYRQFVRDPNALLTLDDSCARRVAPVHVVADYPADLAASTAARALPGNTVALTGRQLAALGLDTVGDEVSRWEMLGSDTDQALLGGTVSFSGWQPVHMRFTAARLTRGVEVSGTAVWDRSSGAVSAELTVRAAGIAAVVLDAHWNVFAQPGQLARLIGHQGARRLRATLLAP